ncbi:hypothetical protein QUA30_26395 [Microcoleus sp. Pol14C2]|uniref:hypothetical protein n=1 Tax=unclassified Microcoleus TaxID=2642155 RepID=UPI002FD26468
MALLSYSKASQEIEVQTGVKIGHTSLQRLVENQEWVEPVAFAPITETSVDGGKVRVRGPKGEGSHGGSIIKQLVFMAAFMLHIF